MITNTDLIERSRTFAQQAHGAINHKRRYTGEPYATHLEAVAKLVKEVSDTPEMIAAAWLHDTVEDTAVTISQIRSEFGNDVAALVDALTDVSKPENGNRAFRKALDCEHLSQAQPAAQTIKLADLIDNARSIIKDDPGFAGVYMAEKRLLLNVLRDGNPTLYAKATEIVAEYFDKKE